MRLAEGPDLASYDWLLVNSSGGKDSQAMLSAVVARADAEGVQRARIVVVHADLGRVEWPGTRDLARAQAGAFGLRFEVVARDRDLLWQIEHERGKFPDKARRYCTSDHKTSQVVKLMTRLVAETDPKRIGRKVSILNCLGMRAQESTERAQRPAFGPDPAGWVKVKGAPARPHGKRVVDRWLPLHHWTTAQVWAEIERSGLPHHPAYDAGMSRLSCVFCVLASRADLDTAVRLNPALAGQYAAVERRIGHTFKPGLSMAELIATAPAAPAAHHGPPAPDARRPGAGARQLTLPLQPTGAPACL
jgi:3'-phosphoadenosine 5'-phosphosulfate sulfotransferase (PAPS reductase)/FAD synthetase